MNKNKNKKIKTTEGGLIHIAAALVFTAVAAFVCLVAMGVLKIRLPGGNDAPERTKTPGELAYESYLASLTPSPDTTKAEDDITAPVTTDDSKHTSPEFSTISELAALGYKLSYDDYNSGMKLAELSLAGIDDKEQLSLYSGRRKIISVMTPTTLEDGGIPYEAYTEKVANRMTVETYMGYFILDYNDEIWLFNFEGTLITTIDGSAPVPANTRDKDGHPLFVGEDSYYYFDENGATVTVEYDPKNDSRGLLFDYAPSFGINSDPTLNVCWQTEPVTLEYTLDRDSYYTRYAVDPRLARVLYETDPAFAERVAIRQQSGHYYNYPFKLALDRAKEAIAREQAEAATAETTDTAPLPEIASLSPAELAGEITTTAETATEQPAPETTPETTPEAATDTIFPEDTVTPADTTLPEGTTPTEAETTEEPYDPMLNISVTFDSPRYYYGDTPANAALGGYARAYAFSEGYACIVDDYGVLKVINKYGRITARLRYEYRTDAAHGYTYMVRTYYQPIYNDIYSLGYYYFDHGYMRVRVIEHEMIEGDVVNYVTADYDILIDPWGNEFDIPSGYKLVSYSDGVLLLERDGRYGYYHIDGHWIAQPVYSYAMPFVEGLGVLGTSDGDMGMVDTSGQIVLPFEYEYISTPSSGVIACFSVSDGWTMLAKMTAPTDAVTDQIG